jgi:hypothetical protein
VALQAKAVEMTEVCVKGGGHPIANFRRLMRRPSFECGPTRLPLN